MPASGSCWLSLIRLHGFLAIYPEGDLVPCPAPPTALTERNMKNMYDVMEGQESLARG